MSSDLHISTCNTDPKLKHNLGPIFVPYLPNNGLNRKRDRLAIPKTNPYCAGDAPFSLA